MVTVYVLMGARTLRRRQRWWLALKGVDHNLKRAMLNYAKVLAVFDAPPPMEFVNEVINDSGTPWWMLVPMVTSTANGRVYVNRYDSVGTSVEVEL